MGIKEGLVLQLAELMAVVGSKRIHVQLLVVHTATGPADNVAC